MQASIPPSRQQLGEGAALRAVETVKMNKKQLKKQNVKNLIIILFFFTCVIKAQDSASVQVIARSLPNKVMLRWAVDRPLAWKKANEYGFFIERATISRNGEAVVPIERQPLVSEPLKPKSIEEWAALANQDQNVAVLAQSLFGDSFEVSTPGSKTGSVFAVNDELEQRFTFALIAAEQNYEAAKLAGWAIEDHSTKPGEKYLYTVSVAIPLESSIKIKVGSVYASPDLYEELPKPIGLAGVFGDGHVTLSWNFDLLQNTYSHYVVERSKDPIDFERLNGVPLFNAQESKKSKQVSLFYTDSISNNITYYYRVKGKTAFDETGPGSDILVGKAVKELGFVPRIYKKVIPTDNKAIIYWEFDKKGEDHISGFELRRSNSDKGPYTTVKTGIPSKVRETTFEGLQRSNYFTIVAMGIHGVESESFPALVQPVDSTPPAPPVGLMGTMDTMGIVRLRWQKNIEDDLGGYRILRSNNPTLEYSEVTAEPFSSELYADTVPVRNLNNKIYYKIQSEDQRYNRSGFSEVLIVDKPDMIPPSSPVLKNYRVTEEGIRLVWIPSSSSDVAGHLIYRKNGQEPSALWQKVFESSSPLDTLFIDKPNLSRDIYSYTVVAKDSAGLESEPSNPLTAVWSGKNLEEDDINFSGTVNRELRFINLTWKVKNQEVVEYRLYRGKDGNGLRLFKTLHGDTKGYNDKDLEVSTEYKYGLQIILSGGRTSLVKKLNLKY